MTFKPVDFRSTDQKVNTVAAQLKEINEKIKILEKAQGRTDKHMDLLNDVTGIEISKTSGIIESAIPIKRRIAAVKSLAGRSASAGVSSRKVIIPYTWAITGTLSVSSYAASVVVRNTYTGNPTPITSKIVSASYQIASGTNLTWKLQKNGSDLAGYGTSASPLTATTTAALNESLQTLTDQDTLRPVLVGFSGTPTNFNLTVHLEYTI